MTDVAVVGSGPNGLAAAVTMARAGLKVHVFEAAATPGGGLRTAELMEPGHFHDVCSAVHPMVLASPFFRRFELSRRVPLEVPELSYGSPLDGGRAALAYRSLDRTVAELGRDGAAYRRLMEPLVRRVEGVADLTLNQLLRIPADPAGSRRVRPPGARTRLAAVECEVQPGPGSRTAERRRRACRGAAALDHRRRRRADAGRPGPCRRLADSARRIGRDCPGADRRHRSPWRGGRDREADHIARGAAAGPGHPAGCGAPRAAAPGGGQVPGTLPARPGSPSASGTRPARSTSSSPDRCRGRRTASPTPGRCTWAAPGRKPPKRSAWLPRDGTRTGPTCWSPSPPVSMPAARRPAGTSCGPIATFRPAPPWT